ncbi:MAG TPA: porin [Verrucomicrobiae bacterium]|nr:porin [Verrucomicrobiae bacterium]
MAAVIAGAIALPAAAQSQQELDQRLKVIERKLEIQAEEAQAKAKDTVTTSAGDKGFGWKSADGAFEFKFKGLLQADARAFVGDPAAQGLGDTFLLRRVEPTFEFTLGQLVFFRLQPQFAGDSASASDVYGELRFHPAFGLRAGKFKSPVGLEYLQSTSALIFVERGLPTELGAGRDLGLQLQGEFFAGTTQYQLEYGNGTPDGRDAAAQDSDNRKEAAARLFFEPFKNDPGFLQGLGFGVAGTQGSKLNTVGTNPTTVTNNFNNTLPRYRSPGQSTIFTYLINAAPTVANTVVAAGQHTRVSPQLYFYNGSFGLLAEHITSEQEVAINGAPGKFEHVAYQGAARFVLTGEDASHRGVKPGAPWQSGGDGFGAIEVAARYGVLDIDDAVFPVYASPAASVSEARSAGAALNWYLTGNARIGLDYEETDFTGGAAAGGDRDREQAVFTRFQYQF